LLLSARQRGGLRQRLRRLLGVCLPVDVPVAPSSTCISFTVPHSWTDSWFGCNKIIHLRFMLLLFVICVMISWWFCCIYAWLDPGAYMIARFMFFISRVWHPTGQGVTPFEVRLEPLREDLRTWAGVIQVGSATAGIRANKCTLEI
jgi:hypothetical protein